MNPSITKIETSLSLRKNWLLAGYELTYTGKAALLPGGISEITSRILKEVLPELVSETAPDTLINIKGRTPSDYLIPTIPPNNEHELWQIVGDVASAGEEDEPVWEPFSISALTRFREFIGLESAKYTLIIQRSKTAPHEIPLHLIADAITIRLHSFRFGFEHFQPTTQKYFFGYTPAVQEIFLLDMTTQEVKFQLRVDGNTRVVKDPLVEVPQLSSVLRTIGSYWGEDLISDFQKSFSQYL
jgi:hypothetical protein